MSKCLRHRLNGMQRHKVREDDSTVYKTCSICGYVESEKKDSTEKVNFDYDPHAFEGAEDKDDVVLIVPSDHLINDIEAFNKTVEEGRKLAEEGYIVTFGIQPSYPETGYGYIKTLSQFQTGYKVQNMGNRCIKGIYAKRLCY